MPVMHGCDDCARTTSATGCYRHSAGETIFWDRNLTAKVAGKTPHKCPVCGGRGTVHAGFYSGGMTGSTVPERCQSCGGGGVLWS